jgi:glycosyltransferase involved in cell wall biosynthesis
VPAHAIPELLSSMDAAVAPYSAQPQFYFSPLKVLEYMAAGLPVVASRIGQIQELIRDGETGLLCEPDDAIALAERLRQLRGDPGLRSKLGTAARDAVLKNHTWLGITQRVFAHAGMPLPACRSHARSTDALLEVRC